MKVTITSCVNHGGFLQTFADVTLDDKTVKKVSYCHKSLPFTEDGVFNALMMQALAPPYVETKPDHNAPKFEPPKDVPKPVVDTARVAKVKALKDVYKSLSTAAKTVETVSSEALDGDK